ncbi:MAG: YfiR family protein [Candidatus Hydrogenedentes bacterium]|nr:YfiR family protein [Candidatus Hydrogenedentota bacterium]
MAVLKPTSACANRFVRACARSLCGGFLIALLCAGASAPRGEYEVKAAFLYKFAGFVEWPAESFPEADTAFRIGILGEDPFKETLDEMAKKKTVLRRRIEIHRSGNAEDLKQCHIVFVSAANADKIGALSDFFDKTHTLTVGESKGFAENGGTINFVKEEDKIRFEINPESARKAGLKISSQLLDLARIVQTRSKETAEHAAN